MFVWCISAIRLLKRRTSKIYAADFLFSGKHFSCKTAARPFVSSSRVRLIWSLECFFCLFVFATLTVVLSNSSQRNKHSLNMAANKSHQAAVLPFILFIFDEFSVEETVSSFLHFHAPNLVSTKWEFSFVSNKMNSWWSFKIIFGHFLPFWNHTLGQKTPHCCCAVEMACFSTMAHW